MNQYIASYDFGTSGCKLALVDMQGNIAGYAQTDYPFLTPHPDWAEQEPEAYWKALCKVTPRAIQAAGAEPKELCAVVFATIWKTIIPLDENGIPLRNAILWLDGRAEKESVRLNERFGVSCLSRKDYWPKLLWYRTHESELYEKTQHILDVSSYLKYRAAGEMTMDMSNHFMRSFHTEAQELYRQVFDETGLEESLFPPVTKQTDRVGRITKKASEESGLPEGIPVFGGCTDVMAVALGSGGTNCGDAHAYLGTSGWYGQITPVEKREHTFLAAPYVEGADITMYGLNAACTAVDWAIARFYPEEQKRMGKDIYPWLEEELFKVKAGADGLLSTTWLYGERPPVWTSARGMYLNMTYRHERQHFVAAMRESAVYMLKWKRELSEKVSGFRGECLRAVGGGAKSAHWMQILADVMEVPVIVPESPQFAGTLGAAACALTGLGELGDLSEAKEFIGSSVQYYPQEKNRDIYRRMYDVYRQLPVLEPLFSQLNKMFSEDKC